MDMDSTKLSGLFNNFIFGLPKDDLKRILVDRILAHGDEHLEGPRELLSVSQVIGPIFFKMLIKSIKNSLKVHNLMVIVLSSALNRNRIT